MELWMWFWFEFCVSFVLLIGMCFGCFGCVNSFVWPPSLEENDDVVVDVDDDDDVDNNDGDGDGDTDSAGEGAFEHGLSPISIVCVETDTFGIKIDANTSIIFVQSDTERIFTEDDVEDIRICISFSSIDCSKAMLGVLIQCGKVLYKLWYFGGIVWL